MSQSILGDDQLDNSSSWLVEVPSLNIDHSVVSTIVILRLMSRVISAAL